jgi:probable rRNA maturation factor
MKIELQLAAEGLAVPEREKILLWSNAACAACDCSDKTMTVRITDRNESAELNQRYRNKAGPTNVLSFPFEDPPGVATDILGDLVICAPVVAQEAIEQKKTTDAHWAHMLVHGVLHLCGYDHISPQQADEMETLETKIITGLGFPPPYDKVN